MKKEIVYILGLSRVGSTLLDLVLGSQLKYIGLGEIYQVIKPYSQTLHRKRHCTCGKSINACEFWGPVNELIAGDEDKGVKDRYQLVIDAFEKQFGKETILVDSSKLLHPLKILLQTGRYDIKVIYLIRDVRAWTISRLNTRKTWPAYFNRSGNYIKRLRHHYGVKVELLKWALPFLTKTSAYFFWIWYLQNRAYKNFLLQNEVKHIQIGYDELGMHKEEIMSKVRQFVGGADHSGNYSTEQSRSHILVGNVKKSDPKRRKDIIYDNRWLYRTEWLSSAAIYRNIMNFNNKEVYRNIRQIPRW